MVLVLLCVVAANPQVAVNVEPVIWAGVRSGPHGVGVARARGADPEVTYWYPALAGGRPAKLRDFSQRWEGLREAITSAGLTETAARAYGDASVKARWDAPVESGKFPLVLIGQGNLQDALDQAVLAEIVASHGFVVATTPSPTLTSPMRTADDVGPTAQKQAEDLLKAASTLAAVGVVDTSRIVVIGHSFGARAALLLAMHDSRIRALVSLDGGIGTSTAQESFTQAPWFSRERETTPILHFYETADASMTPDFTLLRSLATRDLTLRELKGLEHPHFTTAGFQAVVDEPWRRLTGMGPQGPASLLEMMETILRFLATHLAS